MSQNKTDESAQNHQQSCARQRERPSACEAQNGEQNAKIVIVKIALSDKIKVQCRLQIWRAPIVRVRQWYHRASKIDQRNPSKKVRLNEHMYIVCDLALS